MSGGYESANWEVGMSKSTYNPHAQAQAQEKASKEQFEARKKAIALLHETISDSRNIHQTLDYIEKVIHACGGEQKAQFLEVYRDFVKLATRVSMEANLFPFLPDNHPNNIRFHRAVTDILLKMPEVEGVRWLPNERGAQLIIGLRYN